MPESTVSNNARIAKNTIFLYFRMILLMVVSLYTSRVVLATLGIGDYGVYNVVGGFVALFAFLNGAMGGCTQRFITIALGRGNQDELKKVFSTCLITHGLIALIVLLLTETIGLWFVMNKLVIPPDRFSAAMVVYQCSIVSTIVMIMSFPYNADIIAHEKMSAFAYISIYEAFAHLGIVFVLRFMDVDKLALYGILLLLVKVTVIIVYRLYCKRYFIESRFKWIFDKSLFKEMLSFTGWNLFGSCAGTLMGQGVNVLLNIFFGPAVNAARGVAVQVQSAVNMFATNFQTAINPQIMKTYAAGDMQSMHSLLFRSAKFTFMLLLCIMLPLMLEIDYVLDIWLEDVPDYAGVFVCLMLCISMVDAVSNPFMTSSAATGNVRIYQSVVGSILLAIVPVAYIVLKLGGNPYSVFVVHLVIALVAFTARIIIVRKLIDLSVREYFAKVLKPCVLVGAPSIALSLLAKMLLPDSFLFACIVVLLSVSVVAFASLTIGLTSNERKFVLSKIPVIKAFVQ